MDTDYIQMWIDDYKNLINVAYHNLISDLNAGYDPAGRAISEQRQIITLFENRYFAGLDKMATLDETAANRWARFDLIKRGAID